MCCVLENQSGKMPIDRLEEEHEDEERPVQEK
jgi:hypothetical protein